MAFSKEIPEVSTFSFLRQAIKILNNPLPFHHKNFEKHGDTFKLNIGFGNYAIFSRDAGLAEYVLQKNWKNYKKSIIQTQDLAKYLGNGLLTSEGELWRKQRKLIQPAFHKKYLENLLASIKKTIVKELESFPTQSDVDVLPLFGNLAFKVVVNSLFSNAATEDEIETLQQVTEENQRMLVKELRQPYLKWYFNVFGIIGHHLKRSQEAKDILLSIINRRRNSTDTFDDLLNMLLETKYEDGTSMDDEQLIDEILVLFVAGHETTANSLSFTVQLLAHHPNWQTKVRQQYQEINTNNQLDLMYQLTQMQLAKQIIEESLRLYPPAYFIDRVNLEDDEFNDFRFRKGSSLLFSIYEIHRHKDLWEKPDDFDPERFSPDKERNYSSQYFPFGAGPRKCIGNNFAMFEMMMVVSEILTGWTIKPVKSNIEIEPLITLKPKKPIVRFETIAN